MGKFNAVLEQKVQEDNQFEQTQEKLKKQHKIEDENIIVVEKRDIVKFAIRMSIRLVKFIGLISLLILATTGLISLIYPQSREILAQIFTGLVAQVTSFF